MTHRVGTITLGVTMISIGVIYLLQLFFHILEGSRSRRKDMDWIKGTIFKRK